MSAVGRVQDYLVGPNYADPRVADWPLVADWRPPMLISCLYLVGIFVGRRLMKGRPAFKLQGFAVLHNFVLFSLSLYMSYETIKQAHNNFRWDKHFRLWCNPVESRVGGFSDSGYRLARILWIHYLSKAYEFVDTFIMIAKKNDRQVSFLHVYHHASTFWPVWWGVMKYGPGGEAWWCCAVNSAIHVLMYGYYLLAALGVRNNYVKRLITQSQMVQFVSFIAQSSWHLFVTDCSRPRLSSVFLLVQCVIFFLLFFNFYRKTYVKPASAKKIA